VSAPKAIKALEMNEIEQVSAGSIPGTEADYFWRWFRLPIISPEPEPPFGS